MDKISLIKSIIEDKDERRGFDSKLNILYLAIIFLNKVCIDLSCFVIAYFQDGSDPKTNMTVDLGISQT